MFVRNAWYVAAWDHEVGRSMKRRIILDEPVVLYRTLEGKPVALEDRCCHRQAPLSMGKLLGNIVQCPYHGLQFDTAGACVKIPSQDRIPPSARVKSYPTVEKHHWIWIWPGDPAKADPALIEDFHWLGDAKWGWGGNYLHVDANYLLLVENLLDTTHLPFLHPDTLGTDAFARSEFEVTREGDRIRVERYLMDKPPAPFHKQMGDFPDGVNVDRWQITHFGPPCFVKLDIGSAAAGGARRRGHAAGERPQPLDGDVEPERDHARDREDRALLLRSGLQLQARPEMALGYAARADPRDLPAGHGDGEGAADQHGPRALAGRQHRPGQGVGGDAPDRRPAGERGTAAGESGLGL